MDMADSTHPLLTAERERLLAYLPKVGAGLGPPGWFEGLDPAKVILFLYHTGAHPSVLRRAKTNGLRYDAATGKVLWNRPKTKAEVPPTVPVSIRPWISEFIEVQTGRSEKTYQRLVIAVGIAAGLPGMTPRTLRHDFLTRVAEKTGDVREVMRLGACTLKVAMRYINSVEHPTDKLFAEG